MDGFYLGGHIGYGWGDSSSASDDGGFDVGPDIISYETDGFLGGGQIGYNFQTGSFVIGLEAEAGYLGVEGDEDVGDDFAEAEFGAYGILGGRLGIAADRALFYVKGGYALADVEIAAGDTDGGNVDPTDVTFLDETLHGYAIGGGLEYALSSNWTIKAEYLYLDFEDEKTGNDDNNTFNHENDLHTVKFGVNYKFGGGSYEALK